MKGRQLSEEEAFGALRKQAMQSNAKLAAVARQVIEMEPFIVS
jgi:AmiR/NasT family two-component response regulator